MLYKGDKVPPMSTRHPVWVSWIDNSFISMTFSWNPKFKKLLKKKQFQRKNVHENLKTKLV